MKLTIDDVRSRFIEHFDGTTGSVYASPGRINLIGEHTDYNDGFVFPGAVQQGMIAELKPNGTRNVRAYSIDLKDYVEFSLDDPKGPKATWSRYIYGVCGMSSSAALESTYAYALNDMFGNRAIDLMTLAKVGQATEHKYLGVNCGIMDQFASVHGKAGNLMRLDCRSGEFEYFPFNPKGYKLVLINSCVKHELVGSPYNERRLSCERVAAAINKIHPDVKSLRDADWVMLNEVKDVVSEEDAKRAKYVIGEKERVLTVCDALVRGDYETVGCMMYETHHGLSQDYEVSCEELDFLNDVAKEEGVTGSRIMGGGFGGCTINLVSEELYDHFIQVAKTKFKEKFGKEPVVIDVVIGDGSRKLC